MRQRVASIWLVPMGTTVGVGTDILGEEIRHDDEKFGEAHTEDGSTTWHNGADLVPEVLHQNVLAAHAPTPH